MSNIERGFVPEKTDPEWENLKEVMKNEEIIWEEMEDVFASVHDRSEAERIILETIADRYDNALKKTKEGWDKWMAQHSRDTGEES